MTTYKKGQTLFLEGNHSYGMFCIGKGNIKLTKLSHDNKESIVRIVTKGDILGCSTIFNEEKYFWTATAMEDTDVCFFDKKFISSIIHHSPSIALNLINRLSTELWLTESKLISLHHNNVRERLTELLHSLTESHGIIEGDLIKIDLKLSREEIANIVGTSDETIIRMMHELKETGLLEQRGKYIYLTNNDVT
jgi:CRP-like cAMP-binding protein